MTPRPELAEEPTSAPPPRRGRRSRAWIAAPICLLLGWGVGVWSGPLLGGSREPIWSGAEGDGTALRRDMVAMPTLHPIVERVAPGVVAVEVVLTPEAAAQLALRVGARTAELGQPAASTGVVRGTGFIVHESGIVVTNRHLVQGALSLDVQVTGSQKRTAELIGEDPLSDIAVLRILSPPPGLRPLTLGASEELRQGDWVVTISNPKGYTQSVTPGLVSYVGRHLPRHDARVTGDFIQFSAPVNQGSSGGPLFDMRGQVVGVVAQAAADAEGISFAVPSRTLKWVLDEIRDSEDGLVRRGFIGIRFDSSGAEGVMITYVEPGQPGSAAGLKPKDVVLEFDGQALVDAAHFHELVTTSRPGREVRLRVRRGSGEILDLMVVLGEASRENPEEEELDR